LILVKIYCLGLQGRPVWHRLYPLGGEGALGGLPTVRTVFALGLMLCDLHPHRRQLTDLPSLVGAGGHRLQSGPTVPATLDGVAVAVVWLRHGVQRVALVAWLRPALCAAALAQIVRARLLQSVAARGLAAVVAVFSQLVLQGINPGLEVEDEGSQRTSQGQHGFFAWQVGGMNIFWGRQASWYHAVYCARFLSVLHQGMMNFLVCLSSNAREIFITDAWAHRDPSRAHEMSALWPLDDSHHVEADLCVCRMVCGGSVTPRNQSP